jgi:glycosyltransferase involved in cell wall biosynthesis
LPACLNSVINQTIGKDKLEVIVVDDGSTDGSAEYLKEFADQNKNVKLICLPQNSGNSGYARNVGLKAVTGKWLYFVDSDDWLGPKAIEKLVKHAEEWGSDVIQGKMMEVGGPIRKGWTKYFMSSKASIADGNLVTDGVLTSALGPMRLIRMSLLKENNILFPEDTWFVDAIFMLKVLFSASHISVANDYEYYFARRDIVRKGSLTDTATFSPSKRPDKIVKGIQLLFDVIDSHSEDLLQHLKIIKKLFSYQLGQAFMQINACIKQFPRQYHDEKENFEKQVWERVCRYYTPELRQALPVDIAVRWDYAQKGLYDEAAISLLQFCNPKPVNRVKLFDNVFDSDKKIVKMPDLTVLNEDTWERLYRTSLKAAVFTVTDVSWDRDLRLVIKGVYEYPLLVTAKPEVCPVLQYNNSELLFAESTDIKAEVWGEPYQGHGQWEAVFLIKNPVMSGIKKLRPGFCCRYDEEHAAVIYPFRDDRFTEAGILIDMEAGGVEETKGRLLIDLGALIEKSSIEEQLKKAKKTAKQFEVEGKQLKSELNKTKRELEKSVLKNKASQAKLEAAEKELRNMKNSKSWKLTEPLRSAGKVFRNFYAH